MLQQVAVKGLIVNPKGQVLILREAATLGEGTQRGRYQVVGGRVEPGEHFEKALHREVMEETGLKVSIGYPLYVGEWHPVIRGEERQIVATYFLCRTKTDKITLSTEHDKYQWLDPAEHTKYDIVDPEHEVIERYIEMLSKSAL